MNEPVHIDPRQRLQNSLPSPSVTGPMRSGMNSLNLKFRPHQEIASLSRKATPGGGRGRKLSRAGGRVRRPSPVGVRRARQGQRPGQGQQRQMPRAEQGPRPEEGGEQQVAKRAKRHRRPPPKV